ncbi:hypothetical protein C5167_039590 [Papaver somniferum]|uniref:Uncharacterized protein n=1 Tax=Papaver somniferum TaxID=3469 RepID=A0A4Y7IF10_PAPSO|nr:hypothetical protein C5167_039590 [Papaver somniferum]
MKLLYVGQLNKERYRWVKMVVVKNMNVDSITEGVADAAKGGSAESTHCRCMNEGSEMVHEAVGVELAVQGRLEFV